MTLAWIPDPLKQQIINTVVEFVGNHAELLAGQQLGDTIGMIRELFEAEGRCQRLES